MKAIIEKYKQKFFAQEYILVQINLHDTVKIHSVKIKHEGNNIEIIERENFDDWSTFLNKLKKKSPVILHFTGEVVITKKIGAGSLKNRELFFGRSPEDFYVHEVTQEETFVSICRKTIIDEYIQKFIHIPVKIYGFGLGPLISLSFHQLSGLEFIKTGKYLVSFKDGNILEVQESYDSNQEEYKLHDDTLTNTEIGAFSTFLNYLNPGENTHREIPSEVIDGNYLKEERTLKVLGFSIILFFLTSLLISYAVVSYYNSRYLQYEEKLFYLNETYSNLKQLEKEQELNKAIISESGLLSENYISSYLTDLAVSIPNDIRLNVLEYNPISKKIKDGGPVLMKKGEFKITGETGSSAVLNDWITSLKALSWCKNIEILSFTKNRNNELEFELRIFYR